MNIYEAIYKYCIYLNLTDRQISSCLLSIRYIEIKKKVSSEELRRQLGEMIPGIVNMTADALGVTIKEFQIILRKGAISWKEFSEKLPVKLCQIMNADKRNFSGFGEINNNYLQDINTGKL
jgi:tape measure domain-containing protein